MKNLKDYEFYKTDSGTLYNGNCLEILPLLSPNIKLCLTSPPYNISQKESRRSTFFHKGDSKNNPQIYDVCDDDIPEEEYIKQQHQVLKLIYELLLPDGVIFYNHKPRIKNKKFDDRKNLIPFPIRQEIIWQKSSMINFNGNFFVPNTERLFIIVKDKWKPNQDYLSLGEVWKIHNQKNDTVHPSPFPLSLAMLVISSSTKEGDVVLDPFIGSGTTATACERLNRKWIGVEISKQYCQIAKERIFSENNQLKLFKK